MYFLLTLGENPTQLYFDRAIAQTAGQKECDDLSEHFAGRLNAFLDVFDAKGEKIESLKLVDLPNGEVEWTSNF